MPEYTDPVARMLALRGQRLKKGTRTLRARTLLRGGNPGQPMAELTDPKRIKHEELTRHTCGWCGGPVSHSNRKRHPTRVLCHSCMRAEFGGYMQYDSFIRGQITRLNHRRRKWKEARLHV